MPRLAMDSDGALAFRPLAAADLPLLDAWLVDAGLGAPARIDRAALARRLLDDGRILVITAYRAPDGPVAGFVRLDLAPDRTAELTLIVDPRGRRRGVGRALLQHALSLARARDLRRVVAVVSVENEAGAAFFADSGFEPTGSHVPGFSHLERVVHRSDRHDPLEIVP